MKTKKSLFSVLATLLVVTMLPISAFAASFDTTVSDGYYNVLSKKEYNLAPGAVETEIIVNNDAGSRRQILHIMEVDTKNEDIEVLPGYYGIDKLDPDNLADRTHWKSAGVTVTAQYYQDVLGYNVVGAMNTALAYDCEAPYGVMMWNGVLLGDPANHSGNAQTYLAVDKEGNCELRSYTEPLKETDWNVVSANFGWAVKNGELVTKTVERTSSPASRSMIGVKADGTLVFCQTDGRVSPTAVGLSSYEIGEIMLSLGCVNAFNCDGGGSSSFVTKREGENDLIMRSIPSDGAERATINSVIVVSNAVADGKFDHAALSSDYDYYAPGTHAKMNITPVDAAGAPAELPTENVSWELSDDSFGTVEDGVFISNGKLGEVTVKMLYNEEVVGERTIEVVTPDTFGFDSEETVIPYGKSITLGVVGTYGPDSAAVCLDGVYTLTLSDEDAATLSGKVLTATTDESKSGLIITATYNADTSRTDTLKVGFGKGSEIIFDFEDGDISDWMGFDEAKQWSIDNGVNNSLVGSSPLGGQFSSNVDGNTFLATSENGGQVRNGRKALAWSLDNTDAGFSGWTYNVLFNVGEPKVLRDVANGQNATTLGMWLYIPEGVAGMAFQAQLYTDKSHVQAHYTFTTVNGAVKNLNSCTEADIPESRWVYASVDLTPYDYVTTADPKHTYSGDNSRNPSFVRAYIKPMLPAVHTFYIDDITLDYSSAVEDRVLPTITDVAYAISDTSVDLDEGAIIDSNNVTFTATVADNVGVDKSTGQIYVDGIAVDTTVSGKVMASEEVTLTSGVHTISFEIKDDLGNTALVTRTVTISGDAVITLSGHNDSGEPAEYNSIYYADINVADLTSIEELTAVLKLQNANTWELDDITVAPGFEASYEYNDISGMLTVNVKRVDNVPVPRTVEQTLVSIPIRVWSWDAINHVTGEVITPEAQFKSGNCPIVSIDYDVVEGSVEFVDGTNGTFGGKMSVETNLNDNINPWHYHDDELTVLNQEATCTVDGYENRTYCEGCQSVIDWGTTIAGGGHEFKIVEDKLVCDCGESISGSGLVTVNNGEIYYLIADKIITGWQMANDGWCYADPTTKTVKTGTFTVSGVTYTADETGVLTSGVWVETANGRKYSYGPDFYFKTWKTIDGETYYFGGDYYASTGYVAIKENPVDDTEWYHFAEDGKLIEKLTLTGFLDLEDGRHYMVNGVATHAGLIQIDGDYYYVNTSCKAVTGTYTIQAAWTNGLLPAGTYQFDENGKMIIETPEPGTDSGFVTENGATYYYVNGVMQKTGLTKIDGDYYYLSTTNGKMAVNVTRQVAYNCIDNSAKDRFTKTGTYTFGADGKMVLETPEPGTDNGFVTENGATYYYVNGVMQKTGLTKIDGDYYYLSTTNGKMAVNVTRQVAYNCIDNSAKDRFTKTGTYTFDADGKMVIE